VLRVGLPHLALVIVSRPDAGRKRTMCSRGMATASPGRGFRAIPVLRGETRNTPNRRTAHKVAPFEG